MSDSLRDATKRGFPRGGKKKRRPNVCLLLRPLKALLLLVCPVLAQVTIKNPDHLAVPEQRVQIVFRTTCRVVAKEFQLPEKEVEFPLLLILGDPNERYTSDEEHQVYTVYLYRWNEVQFAASAMRLAVQYSVTPSRRDKLVTEILKRSNRIDAISIKSLTGQR
jgi:hypothetical protein